MKQVVVTEPLKFEIQEVAKPVPEKDEVLIQMKAAGVCGSDIHLFLGENPKAVFPRIPGHENIGVVTEVGPDVKNIRVGDHVVIDLVVACGECPQCKKGRFNVCRNVRSRGASIDGGWREFIAIPEKEAHVISKDTPFVEGVLTEPFAIGQHCTKRGNVQAGDVVLVLGSGSIGAIILQVCKKIGATVISVDQNPLMLERALEYGADYVINSDEVDLIERVKEITEEQGVDIAFDSACFPGSLTLLMQEGILANGGTVVPLGFCTENEEISQIMINGREISIIGSRMSTGEFKPTIKNIEEHEYQLEDMVSHYIPYSQIEKVFANIQNPPKGMKKMVILFDE